MEGEGCVSRTALAGDVESTWGPTSHGGPCGPDRPGYATLQQAGRQAGEPARDQASVQARVLGKAPVQVDLEGLLFAGRVADPVARLQQAAALSLQQLAPLVLGQIHGLLGAVPVNGTAGGYSP